MGYVNYRYVQGDTVQMDTYTRPTLASFLWVIGGFLSLVTRLTNFTLAGYQSFTIDKSLIKKIFSWKDDKKKKAVMPQRTYSYTGDDTPFGQKTEQDLLKETIMSRSVFRYTWCQRAKKSCRQKCCCFFCGLCQCFCLRNSNRRSAKRWRATPRKEERLFAEGISKLYTEIDLLEVVKQLRISRFMSSIFLTANQRELIKF